VKRLDSYDALIVIGMMLMGFGVGLWSIPAALVLLGGMMFGLGLAGVMRKAR